ncbi:MAG TPA: zinc-binding protein [Ruminococcus sp.]|nr:zinc-binding protein [Ruminococcus sp.]
MRENSIICSECGGVISGESVHIFDEHTMCEECFERCTVTCDNCGERIWRDESEGDSNYTLCNHCYEYSYTTCEGCGRLIHNEDAYYEDGEDYPYCRECFEKLNSNSIKNYSYKPEPIFYGSGDLFYGIELEIDKGGEDSQNAEKLLDIANSRDERIYCKHDGSISDGFEIVSHPMSLDYHINTMNWLDIFEEAIRMRYRSHNTSTCGLHIHCSRSAFGKNYEEQEKAIGRIVFFVEKHWNELVKFSRRTSENLNRWAAKYATISNTTEETYKKAKDKRMGRYVAVNLENCNTVEFRLFRGTLRYKTFIATLQLVDEICNLAINLSDREMEELSWSDFVSMILPKKFELIEYLKSKRLYVNENSTESEEM